MTESPSRPDDVDWSRCAAVLFDLDGVLTPTAEVHMRAWAEMFGGFLSGWSGPGDTSPYTDDDYFTHVDGRPRYDGVAAFLDSRGIDLPHGEASDAPDAETVCGLGNRKNELFGEVLHRDGVEPYPGSLRLLDHLRDRGTPMAVVSSSRNAPDVLDVAGIRDYFGEVMHGGVATERGLPGKPAPDTFQAAADDLGVPRDGCVVFEDAVSGVRAGAAGGFALVVGVDRGAGPEVLAGAGADLVVDDLAVLVPAEGSAEGSGQGSRR